MLEPGIAQKKINIPFFEGVNSLVSFNIAKKTEFVHAENARSKVIGTIEKREGQTVLGTNTNNQPFVTTANYGLFPFQNDSNPGLYRISIAENPVISINVSETIWVSETFIPTSLSIVAVENIIITDHVNENTGNIVSIYYINSSNQWVPLSGAGANIPGGIFDHTYAEGNVFLSNFNSPNRYIKSDGVTVVTSTDATGHLFKTPPASRINYYKGRLYLADFSYFGIRYKTTILRSSYVMGIIALINEDITSTSETVVTSSSSSTLYISTSDSINIFDLEVINSGTLPLFIQVSDSVAVSSTTITTNSFATIQVTDTKYFYTDPGANQYDIYRGNNFIKTITVIQVNETSIDATWSGAVELLASDEIWLSGTYDGTKIFRWINNPSISGKDVKQYDTFKLSGGENDPITMLTNIGNVMIIANRSNMSSWNDYTLENFDLDVGCVSENGYVKMRGNLYFIHYGGIYSTSGSTPQLISNKIEKYITGATRRGKETSAAGKKGQSMFFTLGDVTLYNSDGSLDKVLRDVCVEYNLIQENWYVHTNVKADKFATFVEESDSDRLEFTDTSGNHSVKEFLEGETDDGEVIHFRIDTTKITMQTDFEFTSNPVGIITEVERGAAIQAFVNIENGEEYYKVDGTIQKGLSIVKITGKDSQRGEPPTCRLISISLRDSSPQLCKISRMSLVYIPTTNEIPNNE